MQIGYAIPRPRTELFIRSVAWTIALIYAAYIPAAASLSEGDRMLINSSMYWPHPEAFFFFASIPITPSSDESSLWLMQSNLHSEIKPIAKAASKKYCYSELNNIIIFEGYLSNARVVLEYILGKKSISIVNNQLEAKRILSDCARNIGPSWTVLRKASEEHVVKTQTFPAAAVRLNDDGIRRWITLFVDTPATRYEVPIDWATSFGPSLFPEQIAIEHDPVQGTLLYPELLPDERKKALAGGCLKALRISMTGKSDWTYVPYLDGLDADLMRIKLLRDGSIVVVIDIYGNDNRHGLWRISDKKVELLSSDSVVSPTLVVSPDGCEIAYAVRDYPNHAQLSVSTSIRTRQLCRK